MKNQFNDIRNRTWIVLPDCSFTFTDGYEAHAFVVVTKIRTEKGIHSVPSIVDKLMEHADIVIGVSGQNKHILKCEWAGQLHVGSLSKMMVEAWGTSIGEYELSETSPNIPEFQERELENSNMSQS